MADRQHLDDLRRRVQQDPTSIAFAQLAEDLRRAGELQEAIDTCHAGLEIHPEYVWARVTLGRALSAVGQLDEATAELQRVLRTAPENLAAIRALANLSEQRGTHEALAGYRAALPEPPAVNPERDRALRTVAALERFAAATRTTKPV